MWKSYKEKTKPGQYGKCRVSGEEQREMMLVEVKGQLKSCGRLCFSKMPSQLHISSPRISLTLHISSPRISLSMSHFPWLGSLSVTLGSCGLHDPQDMAGVMLHGSQGWVMKDRRLLLSVPPPLPLLLPLSFSLDPCLWKSACCEEAQDKRRASV